MLECKGETMSNEKEILANQIEKYINNKCVSSNIYTNDDMIYYIKENEKLVLNNKLLKEEIMKQQVINKYD